jgi:aminoglycoside N3'-acetyltransferase
MAREGAFLPGTRFNDNLTGQSTEHPAHFFESVIDKHLNHFASQHWAALIEDAQRPALLSSRDGKLLKPVPSPTCLTFDELAAALTSLPRVFLLKLVAGWAKGELSLQSSTLSVI